MNDSNQVLLEGWAQGARIRLYQFGDIYYVSTEFMAGMFKGTEEHIYFLTSEWSDAFIFHMKYSKALLDGMDNPELLLPYPWMYELGEPEEETEEEFEKWLIEALGYKDAPFIECPHCNSKYFSRSTIYKMMRRCNPSQDLVTLGCPNPNCGKEIKTYGYNEYYDILGVNE